MSFESKPTKRDLEVRKLFADAGFKIVAHKDAQNWLWNRFAFNVAMEMEVLKSGSFENIVTSYEALAGIGRNMEEIIQVLKAKGSKIGVMTKVFGALPPRAVGLLMSNVMSPNGMSYELVKT